MYHSKVSPSSLIQVSDWHHQKQAEAVAKLYTLFICTVYLYTLYQIFQNLTNNVISPWEEYLLAEYTFPGRLNFSWNLRSRQDNINALPCLQGTMQGAYTPAMFVQRRFEISNRPKRIYLDSRRTTGVSFCGRRPPVCRHLHGFRLLFIRRTKN